MMSRRPLPFVLAAANHGSMIVNRLDYRVVDGQRAYGVGHQILNAACFDPEEIDLLLALLRLRRKHYSDGVMALDCGANIGALTLEWARFMHGWGQVLAFEPQERLFYALAGNLALNNCFNATARWAAVGSEDGTIRIPLPDYTQPASFGSLELRQRESTEPIGQAVSYDDARLAPVAQVRIDSLDLPRVDLIKIDVEGMELEVLAGAAATLAAQRPVLMIEVIKSDRARIESLLLGLGYRWFPVGINLLAVHEGDPLVDDVRVDDGRLALRV